MNSNIDGKFKFGSTQAGSLLGMSAMFFAGASNAAVVTSTGAVTLKLDAQNTSKTASLNSVSLTNSSTGDKSTYTGSLTLASATGFVTSNIGSGTVIGAQLASSSSSSQTIAHVAGKDQDSGGVTSTGIYGFSFVDSNNITNYGWANITGKYDGKSNYDSLVATVNAFAYTNAGENIIAGAPTATTAVPEADSLAMLAAGVGLIGLTVHRRRKSNAAKSYASFALAA